VKAIRKVGIKEQAKDKEFLRCLVRKKMEVTDPENRVEVNANCPTPISASKLPLIEFDSRIIPKTSRAPPWTR